MARGRGRDTGEMEASREEFERLVADALDGLPEELGRKIDNVAVMVEDWPTAAQLGGRTDITLLGRYEGVALTRRSPLSYAGAMPDRIYIFKGPICERSNNQHELAALIRTTVIHEVGHHFGISDARLHELGW